MGEEKILLIAQESKDEQEMSRAMRQVVQNCTFGKVDPTNLTTFDLEYIFLQLRCKSTGELQTINLKVNDPEAADTYVEVEINLAEVGVEFNSENNNMIKVNDTVMIQMKYPTVGMVQSGKYGQDNESMFALIADCVEFVYSGDESNNAADYTTEEMLAWLETLPDSAFIQIRKFFETLPAIRKTIEFQYKTKSGEIKQGKQVLEGLQDFFS